MCDTHRMTPSAEVPQDSSSEDDCKASRCSANNGSYIGFFVTNKTGTSENTTLIHNGRTYQSDTSTAPGNYSQQNSPLMQVNLTCVEFMPGPSLFHPPTTNASLPPHLLSRPHEMPSAIMKHECQGHVWVI